MGLWDTLLVFVVSGFVWLYLEHFGHDLVYALVAGTLVWLEVFVIFSLGLYNMNLATPALLGVALPLAWVELAIAALIVFWGMRRLAAVAE